MMGELASIMSDINRCSRCGGCQAVCPLFGETKLEPLVARGKIFLLKNYLEGKVELSAKMKELMSLCLLCKACVAQCPNQIPVDRMVLRARAEVARPIRVRSDDPWRSGESWWRVMMGLPFRVCMRHGRVGGGSEDLDRRERGMVPGIP